MAHRPALARALPLVLLWLCLLPGGILAHPPTAQQVVIVGALAPARPRLLYEVEDRRIRNGWGLSERAEPGTILLAVGDCALLGASGRVKVAGVGQFPARVVDCQQAAHRAACPLEKLGIAADFDGPPALVERLAHRQAVIVLERE